MTNTGNNSEAEILRQKASELVNANKELAHQNKEKEKRATELIIANKELAHQNEQKEKRAAELVVANIELAFQHNEKEKRASELIIANKELTFQNEEKEKRAAELVIANKELAFQNDEKVKRAAELIIANKELTFQNEEKEKRAAELARSKQLLEETGRLARIGGWEIDLKKNELIWSDIVYQIHEIDPNYQPTVESGINFYTPEAIPVISEAVRRAIEEGKSFDVDLQLITAKQNRIWVRAVGRAYRVDGEIVKIGGVFQDINERKHAEEALRVSENNYHDLVEQTRDIIFSLSPQGLLISLNQAFEHLTGLQIQEWLGKPVLDLLHPEDFSQVSERFSNVLKGYLAEPIELHLRKKSGDYILCEILASPRMKNEMIIGLQGIIRDITERKRAENALRESENRLKDIIFSMAHWVWEVDENGVYTYSSQKGFDFFGPSREDVIGKTPFDFMPPDEAKRVAAIFSEIATNKAPIKDLENWNIMKNGERICLLTNGVPMIDKAGNLKGYRGVDKDITERKRAEQELIIANKELVFQNKEKEKRASELIIANKELNFQNEEKEKRAAELIIANKELTFQNEEKEKRAAELVVANKELVFQNKEKEKRAAELVIANKELAFQNDEKGKRASELIIANKELLFQNEEKEKRAAELIKAWEKAKESDNLKSAFLRNLSHEIRTPMNQILGFASLLKDSDLTEITRDEYLGIINSQSLQLLHIITDIVEISKIATGQIDLKLDIFNLGVMMDELLASFKPKAEQRNLQLSLNKKIADTDALIRGDQVKLNQIFSNLIENAIKFTNAGSIDIEYSKAGDRLIITVKDTGIGIEEHVKQVIFDHFRQIEITTMRQYGGLGLGLSISNAYIRMMSGVIRVESEPGEGSTFFVEIPYLPAVCISESTMNVLQIPVIYRPDWQDKTLLIAEDEESNVQYLTAVLQSTGIHLLIAVNGLEAVEQCKIHPEITLVLMDIKMPRMDGLEATKTIKSFRSNLPVIAITAFAMANEREYILDAGCDDHLSKPFTREDLIRKIQKYMSRRE